MKYIFSILLFVTFHTLRAQCLEGDCFNGFGKFKCSCGYVFEGEFENGEKVYGTLTKEDLVYTGTFKNDVAEGVGIIRFIDSTWYEGEFVQSFPEGFGKFHFADGTTYTGEMEKGKFNGPGVMQFYNSSGKESVLEMGLFENDQLVNFGVIADTTGGWFLGEFSSNQKNGFGLVYSPGESFSAGRYRKNKKVKEIANYKCTTSDSNFTETLVWKKDAYTIHQKPGGIVRLTITDSDGNYSKYEYDSLNQTYVIFPFSEGLYGVRILKDGEHQVVKVEGDNWVVQPKSDQVK